MPIQRPSPSQAPSRRSVAAVLAATGAAGAFGLSLVAALTPNAFEPRPESFLVLPAAMTWNGEDPTSPAALAPPTDQDAATPPPQGANAEAESGPEPESQNGPENEQPVDDTGAPERPEAVVLLASGRQFTGFLLENTDERLVLEVSGIATPFPKKDVRAVRVLEPVEVRYRQMRQGIPATDAVGRLQLAQWLLDRGRYEWALDEVNLALIIEPYNEQAEEMSRWLQSQIKLNDARKEEANGRAPRSLANARAVAAHQEMLAFPGMTEDDINLIRVFELDLRRPGKITISKELIDKLIDLYGTSELMPQTERGRQALYTAPPQDVLRLMFRVRSRELYPLIKVHNDPPALETFREEVHGTWLVNRCATYECHGGQDAGRLWLRRTGRNTDETVYSNFYILDQFRFEDGEALLNYDRPAESRLLQLLLPREVSRYPHPDVQGRSGRPFRPVFRSAEESGFRDAVNWIAGMYTPRPEYGVSYEPPVPERSRTDRPAR